MSVTRITPSQVVPTERGSHHGALWLAAERYVARASARLTGEATAGRATAPGVEAGRARATSAVLNLRAGHAWRTGGAR